MPDAQGARDLPDAVAIQYAKMALGESIRGMFPTGVQFTNWEDFIQALKPKFLLHTADWSLYLETQHWQMGGDWPRFHAIVQTYRLFIPKDFHHALMLHMIKALDPYLQRKVIKEPRPKDLDDAINRTWEVFRTAQPPTPLTQQVSQHAHVPAIAPPQQQAPQQMELDLMRQAPRRNAMTFNALNPQYNAFSGKLVGQTFGRGSFPQQELAQINAVQDYPPRSRYAGPRRDDRDDRRQGRPERRREDRRDNSRSNSRDGRRDNRRDSRDRHRSDERSDSRDRPRRDDRRDDRDRRESRNRDSPRSPRRETSASSRSSAYVREENDRRRPQDRKEQYNRRSRESGLKPQSQRGPRDERAKSPRDGRPNSRKGCFFCGDDGHWAAECPKKSRRPPRSEKDKGRAERQPSRSPSSTSSRQSGNPSGR